MADETIAGRYRLIEPLGRGAMSAVWLAEDAELGRLVAVKTLAPTADRARFEREARAAASLSHPNIAGLYDYGEAEGRPYMVLEHLSGGTLEDRLRRGPLPDAETRRIAEGIAAGLAHAHSRGLVHRDLKPANVLFDAEDRPKIADFGIARMTGTGTLTEAGTVLGTATYISPEQASGEPAGPPSDVYSFGVILFRMLTGQLPFTSTNAMELVRQHRDDPPPTVRSMRPDAPADLAAVADAALAKDPSARPADGAALAAVLTGGAAAATAVLAPSAAATQILRPAAGAPARRRRVQPALLAVVALLLLAGGAAAAWLTTRPSSSTPPAAPPPTVHLPTVTAGGTSTAATTTLPTTTAATTSSTAPTTTAARTTTARTTTAPTTSRAEPTTTRQVPTTTVPPPPATTVAPTTTALVPTTTDTTPTTTDTTTTAVTTTTGP